jgi:hypothetical protein
MHDALFVLQKKKRREQKRCGGLPLMYFQI